MHVWMPEVKPNTTHVVGHFRRELFSLFGFWMGQVVEKQLVQPEGEREGDYKRKKETPAHFSKLKSKCSLHFRKKKNGEITHSSL